MRLNPEIHLQNNSQTSSNFAEQTPSPDIKHRNWRGLVRKMTARPRVLKSKGRSRGIFPKRRLIVLLLVVAAVIITITRLQSDQIAEVENVSEEESVLDIIDDLENTVDTTYDRANATFFVLARNSDLHGILNSIQSVEERFNKNYHYNWVFANNEDFTQEFISLTSDAISGIPTYAKIPKSYWTYPEWIDQDLAADVREQMEKDGVKYGESESYRHMCRFNSGFFYKLKELQPYKYYWRVEPDISFNCDIDYDLFKFMEENKKVYGFTMAPFEIHTTVLSLWDVVKNFTTSYPSYVAPNNNIEFLTDDNGETFNMCHFWSNFEIGDLDFFRSPTYDDFFTWIDYSGGIYYERWGDAPIHTMAMSILLSKDQVHYVDNTGYFHNPNGQCPRDELKSSKLNCDCTPESDYNWQPESCIPLYFEVNNMTRPSGLEDVHLKTHIGTVENSNPVVKGGFEVVS